MPFEIGLRVLDPKLTLGHAVWAWHPDLGWSQTPGGHFEFVYEAGRAPVVVDFNHLGFRDREHAEAKPPGVRRVVVVGDSFSEAIQVDLERTYWHRLEGLLGEATGTNWEVINLGVGDFGTAQEAIALERFGEQLAVRQAILVDCPQYIGIFSGFFFAGGILGKPDALQLGGTNTFGSGQWTPRFEASTVSDALITSEITNGAQARATAARGELDNTDPITLTVDTTANAFIQAGGARAGRSRGRDSTCSTSCRSGRGAETDRNNRA
ncbi:MAG: SGNH/GDSL hydrolase family protein [Gammaproteobacteria bacterium]|nr:SGNH/GDSL hydrolase family protein [Gammaproteobacteria bacterium]